MREMLSSLLSITTLVFAVTSMLAVGFSYTLRQIIEPLRNAGPVVRALAANFVLVPLLAFGILKVFPLDRPVAVGLMVLASAAGAPFLIKLTMAAEGNVALSATLLVMLLPVTVLYLPLIVTALFPDATVSAMSIASPLILSMLLPLGAGLFVKTRASRLAARLQPIMSKISTVALLLLLALTVLLNLGEIMVIGAGAFLAAFLLTAGAFIIGYALASPHRDRRTVLGLGTAQRNVAAAMVVATESFRDHPNTMVMVVLTFIVSMLLLFPIAWTLRKRPSEDAGPARRAA